MAVTALRPKTKEVMTTAELITPEIAGDWLARNTKNRRLRDSRVKRLAQAIRSGEWQDYNGETIKFSRRGELVDGQHRLAAVVVANVPIRSLVAWNIDDEAFRTIDSGWKRQPAESLYLLGEKDERGLAAALNSLWRWNQFKRFTYGDAPTTAQLLETLEQHPNIRDYVHMGREMYKRLPGAPTGVVSCLYYVMAQINEGDATEFFTRLRDGDGLTKSNPIYLLRERLAQRSSAGTGWRHQDEMGALIIRAWNAYRSGRQMQTLRFRPTTDSYPIPE